MGLWVAAQHAACRREDYAPTRLGTALCVDACPFVRVHLRISRDAAAQRTCGQAPRAFNYESTQAGRAGRAELQEEELGV